MSLKTDNFKLYKYEDNDIGDLRFINDSMDIIDKGINPFYVATQSSTNVYKVTTGLNKTSLANGYSIKVAIPSDSTGAVSITVDSVTVPVKKPNGNTVTNFKQNGVYNLTYYNSVFILASGGVDDVSFSASDLLTGKTANDSNGEKVNGTMPNKGTVTQSLSVNGSLTLPSGYYDSIKVTQSITTRGSTTDALSHGVNGNYIYTRIPQGAYFTNASTGYPEIKSKFSDIANAVGLTPDKLVGNVGGINGSGVRIKSGYGSATYDATNKRTTIDISSCGFTPKIVVGYVAYNYKSGIPITFSANTLQKDGGIYANIYSSSSNDNDTYIYTTAEYSMTKPTICIGTLQRLPDYTTYWWAIG